MAEIKSTKTETNSEISEMNLSDLKAWVANTTAKTIQRIADLKAGKGVNHKLRISAVERVTSIPWGRVKSLYYKESRRIDAHEWLRLEHEKDKLEQKEIARAKHEAKLLAERTCALLHGEAENEIHPLLRESGGDVSKAEITAREMAKAIRAAQVGAR